MAETARTIRVVIDPKQAQEGARKVNSALSSIASETSRLSAANDNFSRLGQEFLKTGSSASKAASIFRAASGELGGLGSHATNAASKLSNFASIGRGLATLGIAGILGGIAVGLGAIGVAAIRTAAQVETFKANLTTVTGSVKAAESAYAGLIKFAQSTPFSLDQSIEGFTKLRSLGLATSEEIMTSYGNTSAAMGKSMTQMIEAVADATTGEFERLKEFGIKASKEGDNVAFTFQGMTTQVGNNSKEIQDYLVGIGNTNFGGAMDRQMATVNGAFANLEDTVFSLMATLGDGPFGRAVASMVNTLANGLAAITPLLSGIMDVFGGIVSAVWDITKGIGSMFAGGKEGGSAFQSVLDGIGVTFAFIGEAVAIYGQLVGTVFSAIGNTVGAVAGYIRNWFFGLFGDLTSGWNTTGQSVTENIVGWLRAGQVVANGLSKVFTALGNDIVRTFSQIGNAFSLMTQGDFSGFGKVSFKPSEALSVGKGVLQEAMATQRDQKANRAWIDSRTSKGTEGNIDFGAMGGGGASSGAGNTKSDQKGHSEAEKKAKAAQDFWEAMEKELGLSKLSTKEAEKRRKEMELKKIIGRDLVANEKSRLATLMDQTKSIEFMRNNEEAHARKMTELATDQNVLQKRLTGMTEKQVETYEAGETAVNKALTENIGLSANQLNLIRRRAEAEAGITAEVKRQNDEMSKGVSLIEEALSTEVTRQAQLTNRRAMDASVGTYSEGLGRVITQQDVDAAVNKAATEAAAQFKTELGGRISELGDMIGGKWGGAISKIGQMLQSMAQAMQGSYGGMGAIGGIASIFSSKQADGTFNGIFGTKFATTLSGGIQDGMKGVTDNLFGLNKATNSGFDSLKTAFGKNGDLVKGLGGMMGTAMAGAQTGGMVAGLSNALGLKMSNTGAQIGGAIGSFIPIPGGSIIGSVIGGTIGGLFSKPKWGTATIAEMAGGELGVGNLRGNKSAIKGNASGAAGSVINGLQEIAAQLGADISGSPSVSIGQYKGKWRVSNTGRTGKLKTKYSDVEGFGKNGAEAAIAYAIQESLKDGILTGISQFSQRVMKNLDVEKALPLAQSYEGILRDLAKYNNPIKATVDETIKSLDTLAEQMKAAGATTAELANVEQWRALKLKSVLEDQTSGYQDFLKQLNGSDAGVSSLSLLTRDMKELDKFRSDIASGKGIDQEAFTSLGQSILGYASEIYGTNTSQFQSIIGDLKSLTQQALNTTTGEFDKYADAGSKYVVNALEDQTNQMVGQIQETNALLAAYLRSQGLVQSFAANGQLLKYS